MAVLDREAFTARIKDRIGDSTEVNDLDFMADMIDTFDSFGNKGDTVSKADYDKLKADYDKLGNDYRERFFSGKGGNDKPPKDDDDELSYEDIRIKDLFIERK